MNPPASSDLICFSHLRWDFVWQRPQHLLSRASRDRRVWFVEEPRETDGEPRLDVRAVSDRLSVVVPLLPAGLDPEASCRRQRELLATWWREQRFDSPLLWYYTPMALPFTRTLAAGVVVYDCMDELSLFKGAPPALRRLEMELLERADLVFTGGVSLYEAKKHQHEAVHAFPSSVDKSHFMRARSGTLAPPPDQAATPGPRVGFFGVIDERLDIELIGRLAELRPQYHFVLLGPVVKIDPASLPTASNLHYLGMKRYEELPAYLAGWDVAMLPFARNDATRYISPTKTPEYLAAGCPVVSTSITDVVHPYGTEQLARIADDPQAFAEAIDQALAEALRDPVEGIAPSRSAAHVARADAFLADLSWDRTWQGMHALVRAAARRMGRASQGRAVATAPVGTVAAGPAA
ncbi:glycosyl transferase [Luteitalea sp. TBR-22]|uniref:glycosyltransferase family 1 protein n=1 Tax=Luteitalea sp. TBR-22 TaxID=2802971 RepID=UPI001AF04A11|nr:glycosyltransferase family 1 protein [Luteitalea sp. TBR-22]BCS34439.1 glycosyl transferase [Luteitalea sp. TBR-22]